MIAETETPPVAEPLPLGTPSAPVGDGEALVPAADDDSIAAHEASLRPAEPETEGEREDRDARGQFKPRRRAQSQQAEPDDVKTINELTARFKTLEETHGKDIVKKPGESERVYSLRRRAELLERLASPAPAPAPPAAAPIPQPSPRPQAAPVASSFPTYEQFLALDGMSEATYDDYIRAMSRHEYQLARQTERQQEESERTQRTQADRISKHLDRVTAARAKYTDWDTVLPNVPPGHPGYVPISSVIEAAILSSEHSADVQYYLGSHRDILAALNAESQDYSPSAVAAMRRYLDSLVAAPQRTSPNPRAAAGSTGSAPSLQPPPAPRPPNPVRTSATTPTDDPPGDDSESLAAHEKHYRPSSRR